MNVNKMTHINYKDLKERMSQILKGFWKVQSIHKLSSQPRIKINNKEYLLLTPKSLKPTPSFISFCHEEKHTKQLSKSKSAFTPTFNNKNIFITSNIKRKNNNNYSNKNQDLNFLYKKIYGKFTYEPYIYNEFQMFCMKRQKEYQPRRFKDVIKDCIAMKEYNNYLNNIQRSKSTFQCRNINKFKIKKEKNYFSINLNGNNKNTISEDRNKKIIFNDDKIFSISRLKKNNIEMKNDIFPVI